MNRQDWLNYYYSWWWLWVTSYWIDIIGHLLDNIVNSQLPSHSGHHCSERLINFILFISYYAPKSSYSLNLFHIKVTYNKLVAICLDKKVHTQRNDMCFYLIRVKYPSCWKTRHCTVLCLSLQLKLIFWGDTLHSSDQACYLHPFIDIYYQILNTVNLLSWLPFPVGTWTSI